MGGKENMLSVFGGFIGIEKHCSEVKNHRARAKTPRRGAESKWPGAGWKKNSRLSGVAEGAGVNQARGGGDKENVVCFYFVFIGLEKQCSGAKKNHRARAKQHRSGGCKQTATGGRGEKHTTS